MEGQTVWCRGMVYGRSIRQRDEKHHLILRVAVDWKQPAGFCVLPRMSNRIAGFRKEIQWLENTSAGSVRCLKIPFNSSLQFLISQYRESPA
jgi:hypothetical protein